MNLRDTILQEATNVIDSISEYSRLRVDERLTKSSKYSGDVLVICGGRNGNGEWEDYFRDLGRFVEEYRRNIRDIWLIELENDVLDDVFYATFGVGEAKKS